MTSFFRAPTPIVVGVSGHRDLRAGDLEPLSDAVDAFFAGLQSRYPASGAVVLTGLATGADELVAARARALSIPYIAVLPMPTEAYRDDFAAADRERFDRSLEAAASIVELPYLGGHTSETLRGDEAARAHQYDSLGIFLASHSMILLALWNGKVVDAAGGTSRVVARATSVGLAHHSDQGRPRAFVYRIATPRETDPVTDIAPFTATPMPAVDETLTALDEIERWNGQAAALLRQRNGSPEVPFDATICERAFALADELAIRDQKHTHRAIDRTYWFTLVAGIALTSYGNLTDIVPGYSRLLSGLSIVFLLATLAAAWTVYRIHLGDVQNRFHDYRTLAEGLRVQNAYLEAGVAANAADNYEPKYRAELDWIRRTIGAVGMLARAAPDAAAVRAASTAERLQHVAHSWIEDQRAYFERASVRNERAADRSNRIALGWLRVSLIAGVLIACDGVVRVAGGTGLGAMIHVSDDVFKPVVLSLLGWAASLAALEKGKSTLRGYRQIAIRFRAMHATFVATSHHLTELFSTPGEPTERHAADLIVTLGKEALTENGDWLLSQRDRPLDLIWAG